MSYKKQTKADKNAPHIIIDAGPGCGKTTTMVAGLNLLQGMKPEWFDFATDEQKEIWEALNGTYTSIAFQAFNRSIAQEIGEKVPSNVKASTFHAHGGQVLRTNGYKLKPSSDNDKFLVMEFLGYDKKERMTREHFSIAMAVSKVVGLLKNNLLEPTQENVGRLCDQNGIEGDLVQLCDLAQKTMEKAKSVEPGKFAYMSFDDMLWLPVVKGMDFDDASFDLLICDESQDLNAIQHHIVSKTGKRLICVGDPRQAIYGFRGADSNSMQTLQDLLSDTKRGVKVLDLQVSFRLPKSGVQNVVGYAPNLKATDDAIEGEINTIQEAELKPEAGDLVLSRINANIFSLGFRLLRERTPVQIQGRDFSKQLLNILKKCNADDDIKTIVATIGDYDQRESERIQKKTFHDAMLANHQDKMRCLYSMTDDCNNVGEMIKVIEDLFSEDLKREDVVLLSTIHRAKGLEADNVFFLEPQLVPHKMAKRKDEIAQEYNLKFVAETRHKKSLTYVMPSRDDDFRDEEEGRV